MLAQNSTILVRMDDASRVGEVRRLAVEAAVQLGLDGQEQGRAAIVATEMANNLLRHAQRGEIMLQSITWGEQPGLELVAIDNGPGIADLELALQDGFSTGGTSGTGLGATKRMSSVFEIQSTPGLGTVVVARIHAASQDRAAGVFEGGAFSVPVAGESQSGDAWAADGGSEKWRFLVADGLGHGDGAARASQEAVRLFGQYASLPINEILTQSHAGMRATRGAALAIAEIDLSARVLRFAGVGNICGLIFHERVARSLVSLNGTVGAQVRKVQVFDYPWPVGAMLVLNSDGLETQLHLERYPEISNQHPALLAAMLYRDHRRPRDDATVLVVRELGERPTR